MLKGETIKELLSPDFQLLSDVKKIFENFPAPSYESHINLAILNNKMMTYKYPMGQHWDMILSFSTIAIPPRGGKAFASRKIQQQQQLQQIEQQQYYKEGSVGKLHYMNVIE